MLSALKKNACSLLDVSLSLSKAAVQWQRFLIYYLLFLKKFGCFIKTLLYL